MRKTDIAVLVALAVLASAGCQSSPVSPTPTKLISAASGTEAKSSVDAFMGTWQATKAEGSSALKPGVTRDIVAEGGTVSLVLEANSQALGLAIPDGKYTITVTMPGTKPGVDSGFWFYGLGSKGPQIDFYPSSLGPDAEYGWIPAFLVALSGNTLTFWDSGLTFLPFDFGWGTTPGQTGTVLNLVFIRE